MGKKGSWFSAIKRVFTHTSKDKPTDGSSDKRSGKEKKKGKGILRHSETKSFIPLFREPSSIEKILGEADQLLIRPNASSSELPKQPPPLQINPKAASPRPVSPEAPPPPPRPVPPKAAPPPRPVSPKAAPPPRPVSPKAAPPPRPVSPKAAAPPRPISPKAAPPPRPVSPKASSSKAVSKVTQSKKKEKEISYVQRPEPTLESQNHSATKIQAIYRGYKARRSFRALRGLVRLQEVVKGQNAKRQTMNAMKQMQLLVRVQTQIQSRRIQMLENQAQPYRNNDKDVESTLSKWTLNQMSESGEDWDASRLTKEEEEARLRRKVEAVIKRERQMAYAYSHRLWKANPKSNQAPQDIRSNGYPWWWNWLERQLHPTDPTKNLPPATPPKPGSEYRASPRLHTSSYKFDNQESITPRSSKSAIPLRAKQFQTTPRTVSRDIMLKDDDSLVSCPPFSVPNYMNPTVSAKAKARANSNPKERLFPGGTPDSKRRFSFPLTPNIGSLKWNNKGNGNRDSVSSSHQMAMERNETPRSVDSTVSMPALGGRKPFNRFA